MSRLPKITREDFEAKYAECSGMTVEELRAAGRTVEPCDCDYEGCEGWQSVSARRGPTFSQLATIFSAAADFEATMKQVRGITSLPAPTQ